MSVKKRILAIRLLDQCEAKQEYFKQLGVDIKLVKRSGKKYLRYKRTYDKSKEINCITKDK